MRALLWPEINVAQHAADIARQSSCPASAQWRAIAGGDEATRIVGFAEAALRQQPIWGASPAVHLESVWVAPDKRKAGLGKALVAEVEAWARRQQVFVIQSEAELSNRAAMAAHKGWGFEEAARIAVLERRLKRT